jgi:hypothetical protein
MVERISVLTMRDLADSVAVTRWPDNTTRVQWIERVMRIHKRRERATKILEVCFDGELVIE